MRDRSEDKTSHTFTQGCLDEHIELSTSLAVGIKQKQLKLYSAHFLILSTFLLGKGSGKIFTLYKAHTQNKMYLYNLISQKKNSDFLKKRNKWGLV